MNIFVCLKRTFDTEETISIQDGRVSEDSATFIINPYDEYAVEETLKLKEDHGGEVTVVTVGEEEAEKELRTALAMGADKAVLIKNEDLEYRDQFSTAAFLAAYFKDKEVDIILVGKVTVDGGSGQVGAFQFIRPIYSGKAFEKLIVLDGITLVTIRPNNIAPLAKDVSRAGDVAVMDVVLKDLRTG